MVLFITMAAVSVHPGRSHLPPFRTSSRARSLRLNQTAMSRPTLFHLLLAASRKWRQSRLRHVSPSCHERPSSE